MLDRSTPWLLVPVKALSVGKQRLSGVLSDSQRQRLNHFFLCHTLEVASGFPGLDRTAVVSDAEDVLTLARSVGARTICTPRHELNGALADGCSFLIQDNASAIIVLPVDLPAIQPADLEEIADLGLHHNMVICPDRHAVGTNAMFVSSTFVPNFHFGADSFRLHQMEARRGGITPKLFFNKRIEMDVDLPVDLEILGDANQSTREPHRYSRAFGRGSTTNYKKN